MLLSQTEHIAVKLKGGERKKWGYCAQKTGECLQMTPNAN